MPTLREQLDRLADLAFPPLNERELISLEAARRDLALMRASLADKKAVGVVSHMQFIADISKEIRSKTADTSKLKQLFVDSVMAMRKGKDIRIGNGFVSFKIPSMTLQERLGNGTDLNVVLDDLRLTFELKNRTVAAIKVKSTEERTYAHPSVYHDGTCNFNGQIYSLAGKLDLAGCYDEIVKYLNRGDVSTCYVRNLRGDSCRHCGQRGGHGVNVRLSRTDTGVVCSLCSTQCHICGVKWAQSANAVDEHGCHLCRKIPCGTCGTPCRDVCKKCNMFCAGCRRWKPKTDPGWTACSFSTLWAGGFTICQECHPAYAGSGAFMIPVDFSRYPHLLERENVTGETIHGAWPEAPTTQALSPF